ncbi:MAG: pyrroline-5-carboxylate reductase [Anaerolineales bacterium]|nr:pyrroline-5-carboxylate reductase [Anaerolineales bacterium]
MKLAFIGGGNMGSAIIKAVIDKQIALADDIVVSDVDTSKLKNMAKELNVKTISNNVEAICKADVIILAIKPQILSKVLEELKGQIANNQLVVSIIAGATIKTICKGLKHENVVRVMPNTPAQIGKGMSAWTTTDAVTTAHRKMAEAILNALGKQIYFEDEKYMDMATAISGSGPAYIYLIIEALTDAAVHIGLPQQQAEELVLQTVLGSALFLQKSGKHPAELRNMVTSPGGTTAEGLFKLEKGKLRATISKAVMASYKKAKQLGS